MDILKMKDELQRHLSELHEIGGEWAEIKVDELEFLLDRLSDLDVTAKELETLRAETQYLKLNIDRLEALNKSYANQEKRLLESSRKLRDENAALLAEREQRMKQVPVYQYHNSGNSWCDCNKNVYDAMKDEYRRIVYRNPLPAQQVPEGWQLVPIEPTKEMIEAGEAVQHANCSPQVNAHIYKAMLSASQPNGDM